MTDRITLSRSLISTTESRLVEAEKLFAGNRLAICELNSTRSMLKRVRWWKEQPKGAQELALRDLGPNAWGELIDRLCALAEGERQQPRRAA